MQLTESSCREFTELLASKAPVPGGGGASALVGAIGIALGDMVGELTVGKKKYADVEADVKALMEKAQTLRVKLLECVDKDAEAFEPLSRAYAIPKDDPSREAVMEKCLRDAAAVPFEILELACRGILLHRDFAQKGSAMMVSDAGTGVIFCWAALYGAALNVKVNTKLMTDRAYADDLNRRVDALMDEYWKIADAVYEEVYGRFC